MPGLLTGATTCEQANECLKQKLGEEGRRAGTVEGEKNVSMHCGGWTGLEANALVQLL